MGKEERAKKRNQVRRAAGRVGDEVSSSRTVSARSASAHGAQNAITMNDFSPIYPLVYLNMGPVR